MQTPQATENAATWPRWVARLRVLVIAVALSVACHLTVISLLDVGMPGASDASQRNPLQVLLMPRPAPETMVEAPTEDSPAPETSAVAAEPAPQPKPDAAAEAAATALTEAPSERSPEPTADAVEEPSPVPEPALLAANSEAMAPSLPAAPLAEVAQQARIRGFQLNVLAWLQQHRQYPRAARRARLEGIAEVRFILDRDGRLLGSELSVSSGHSVLDRAALDTVKRAAPYPRMPRELEIDRLELELPVEFRLTAVHRDQG